ncbi:hypothetical protein [Xanthomonas vesicatoria]|nr:hypothetical protein [Xanthomonas vesicatoria]
MVTIWRGGGGGGGGGGGAGGGGGGGPADPLPLRSSTRWAARAG